MNTKKVFCLVGPTAIGKTDLACWLTDELPLEIVNLDSSLIYKELVIGAAKPPLAVLDKYPHHLINRCSLAETFSVAQFCAEAQIICEEILNRHKYPLLVGGTMMYLHAFQNGLAKLPAAAAEIRESIRNEAQQVGWVQMHQKLASFDAVTAQRVHPNDQQRISRAFEIYLQSGKTWSAWLQEAQESNDFDCHNLVLLPEHRLWLHQRIAVRFAEMVQAGLLDEVRDILANNSISPHHPALRSVGYRQAIMYLQGELAADAWQEKAVVATRQLAKRQMTWLRSFVGSSNFYQPSATILTEIIDCIKKILDNSN